MNKILSNLLKLLVTILLVSLVIYKIDLNEFVRLIGELNVWAILYIFIILFLMIFIGGIALYLLFMSLNTHLHFGAFMRHYFSSWGISNFLPGTTGEFSLIYFLKQEKVDYGVSSAAFMIDKLITFISLAILSLIAALLYFGEPVFYLILVSAVGGLIVGLIAMYSSWSRKLIRKYILRKYAKKFSGFFKTSKKIFKEGKVFLVLNLILTLMKWFLSAISVWILVVLFGDVASVFDVFLMTAFVTLIGVIPISISGIGQREYAAAFVYPLIGVGSTVVVAAFFILLVRSYILALLVLGKRFILGR